MVLCQGVWFLEGFHCTRFFVVGKCSLDCKKVLYGTKNNWETITERFFGGITAETPLWFFRSVIFTSNNNAII